MQPTQALQNGLHLDAEALYGSMLTGVRRLVQEPGTVLVGVWSGGAW